METSKLPVGSPTAREGLKSLDHDDSHTPIIAVERHGHLEIVCSCGEVLKAPLSNFTKIAFRNVPSHLA